MIANVGRFVALSVLMSFALICTPAAQAEHINLFLIGDSMTSGQYVPALQSLLAASGRSSTVLGMLSKPGWCIEDVRNNMNTWPGYDSNGTWVQRQNLNTPGINAANTFVLLMIGTNDVSLSDKMGTAPARLGTLITAIENKVPLAHLIVANIPPMLHYAKDRVPVYTAAFTTVTNNLKASGVDFTTVDMYTPMSADPSHYISSDSVHPNTTYGYPLIGQVWCNGIISVPEPSTRILMIMGLVTLLATIAALSRRCALQARR